MSYMSQSEDKAPPLSPLPKVKPHPPQSPLRKVSDHHTVFIRPLKMTPSDEVMFNPQSPHKPLCYSFSRSPAKVSNTHCQFSEFSFIPFSCHFLVKNCATQFFFKSQHLLLDLCHLTNYF